MKTFLVVDDDADTRKLLSAILAERGDEILQALDGDSALRIARLKPPDVVLLDVMMPGLDGVEVCRALKTDPRTRHAAVVVITADHEKCVRDRALGAGADAFVTKPFSPLDLLDEIERRTGGR